MLNLLNFLSEKPGYIPIIAAILTFFSSLLGCLLAAFFTGRKDRRDAYRKLLCEHMEEIGSRTYASVALAKILLERIRNNQSRTSWLAKHKENRKVLEVLRNNVRYSLYRCDEGFHKLIRLPTWIDYCYRDIVRCEQLITYGDKIRCVIDSAIIDSFSRGKFPGIRYRFKIKYYAFRMDILYNEYKSKKIITGTGLSKNKRWQ